MRPSPSDHRDDFVLKGGVLLAAFAARRPTKDIDVQATGLANDADEVAERIRQIAVLELPDGVLFDTESITAFVIRDDDEYAGIRVRLVGALGRAQEKWLTWRRRTGREGELPEYFADVFESLTRFADAVLTGDATGRWNPRIELLQ